MDIHKPKPWHGWREFLKEYGIIVLGVLTALAFEQMVKALHWRHEVEIEREALQREVQVNLNAVFYRVTEQGCIDRRLAEIREVFRRQAHGEPLGLRRPTLRPVLWLESTGSWQIAVADQSLSHMPLQEKLTFSDAFDTFDGFKKLREEEDQAWRKLNLLDEGDSLNAADWTTLHADFAEVNGLNDRMKQFVIYPLQTSTWRENPAKPNVGPSAVSDEVKFCQPMI